MLFWGFFPSLGVDTVHHIQSGPYDSGVIIKRFLYHGFGIRGYDYLSSKYAGGAMMFTLRPKAFKLQCSSM